MESFSSIQQHHPFLFESVFQLPTINNMCSLVDEPNKPSFSQFFQPDVFTKASTPSNNDISLTNMDNSSSIVTDHSSQQVTQKLITTKRKSKPASSPNSAQSKDKRQVKGKKEKKMKDCNKAEDEAPAGYIHVRARRGQATDSHSLAERVRRERISERMKLLQALVPGCDKVTGKALMLDEIINYVQSLQNQVEFLSMKLASVNPMFYDFGVDLESFMVRPEQDLSNLASPLPNRQECMSPTTPNDYHLLQTCPNSALFQQAQIPNILPQENRQSLWEVNEHRQKIINQSGLNNTLFSFH